MLTIHYSSARSVLFLEFLSRTHARTLNGSFTALRTLNGSFTALLTYYHKDQYLF